MHKRLIIDPVPEGTWTLISEAPGDRLIKVNVPATSITVEEVDD